MASQLLRAIVNGKALRPSSLPKYELRNAVNDAIVHHFHPCDKDQVDVAVSSSVSHQKEWAKSFAPVDRSRILRRAADLLVEKTKRMAKIETLDTGRPLRETLIDIQSAAECLYYYAGLVPTLGGSTIDLSGGSWSYSLREPIGTTVGIGAWNFPILSAVWKSAPALAFGNSMVFKPSEETPLTALTLAEIYHEAGVPPGVFNVVLGGSATGEALIKHPDIGKVSFTGSLETGSNVYAIAAKKLKRVTMELGGKSPLIIFDDADIEQAVTAAMVANWYSSGQVCSNGTRVFVHQKIKNKFIERLIERTKKLKIGDPLVEGTDIGPMITAKHRDIVKSYIDIGLEENATMVYGSEPLRLDQLLTNGYFLSPVIFSNCNDDMRIVKEEIFGMVMAILSFEEESEVIKRANATEFGLSAGVFTKDIQRAHRTIANLQAGTTWINNYNIAPVETSWGGYKKSGIGRENGTECAESWTQMKSVYVEMNEIESPYQ